MPPMRMLPALFALSACSEYALEKEDDFVDAAPLLELEPRLLDFGEVPLNEVRADAVTLSNLGSAALTVDHLELVGPSSFALLTDPGGHSIGPGESIELELTYTAQARNQEGILRVISDDALEPTAVAELLGDALTGVLRVEPTPIGYGLVPLNERVTEWATLSNVGGGALDVTGLAVSGAGYELVTELSLPYRLDYDEQVQVELAFTPTLEEPYEGELWVSATGSAPSAVVPLTGEGWDDSCFQEEVGFDPMAGASFVVVDNTQPIAVMYEGTNAGYTSLVYLQQPQRVLLATGHSTPEGTVVEVGPFEQGVEPLFGIEVSDTGHAFVAGPGERNPDGLVHAAVTYLGDCVWRLGFEDTLGGGDRDHDDIAIVVSGPLQVVVN